MSPLHPIDHFHCHPHHHHHIDHFHLPHHHHHHVHVVEEVAPLRITERKSYTPAHKTYRAPVSYEADTAIETASFAAEHARVRSTLIGDSPRKHQRSISTGRTSTTSPSLSPKSIHMTNASLSSHGRIHRVRSLSPPSRGSKYHPLNEDHVSPLSDTPSPIKNLSPLPSRRTNAFGTKNSDLSQIQLTPPTPVPHVSPPLVSPLRPSPFSHTNSTHHVFHSHHTHHIHHHSPSTIVSHSSHHHHHHHHHASLHQEITERLERSIESAKCELACKSDATLAELYSVFDKDNKGFVTKADINELFYSLSLPISLAEINKLVSLWKLQDTSFYLEKGDIRGVFLPECPVFAKLLNSRYTSLHAVPRRYGVLERLSAGTRQALIKLFVCYTELAAHMVHCDA